MSLDIIRTWGSGMLVLHLLGVAVVVGVIIYSLRWFDRRVSEKFGHRFFTKNTFVATEVACAFIVGGNMWHSHALHSHSGDPLNGIVLIGVGVVILMGITVNNVLKTNLVFGIGGSCIQLPLLYALAYVSLFLLILWLCLTIIAAFDSRQVYVVNGW